MIARLLTLLLLLGLAPVVVADVPPKPVVVKFELTKSRHILVPVTINDKGPYRLIFDTGAPITIINTRTARDTGLLTDKARATAVIGSMGHVTVRKIEMGDAIAAETTAVVMNHPTVESIEKTAGGPIEGIVGFPFFARFKVTVDYQASTLTLLPSEYRPTDLVQQVSTAILTGTPRERPPETRVMVPGGLFGIRLDKDIDDKAPGVVVQEVLAGGAAARAGLKTGDRILALDGRWTDSVTEAYQAASRVKPGQPLTITGLRSGKPQRWTVTPGTGL